MVITLMKLQKSINSGKKTSVTYLLKLLTVLILLTALSGGGSFAAERNKYRVLVARPGKNVTTQLRVYAINEEEARENVALNGWQILSIEQIMDAQTNTITRGQAPESFSITLTKVGEGEMIPEGTISVFGGDSLEISLKPGPCEKLGKLLYNSQELDVTGETHLIENIDKDGYVVAVFDANGSQCSDKGIFSKDLLEVGAVYFDLGVFQKELSEEKKAMLSSLLKEKSYVIIGHTDDVHVVPNSEYKNNFQLSVKRAKFLMDKLKEMGLSEEKITIVGLGPAFPAAPNKEEGQPLNRRAVVYERR